MMGQLITQPGTHTATSVNLIDIDHFFFNYSCGFYHLKSLHSNSVQRGKLTVLLEVLIPIRYLSQWSKWKINKQKTPKQIKKPNPKQINIERRITSALNLRFWHWSCKKTVKHIIIKELMGGKGSISEGCDTYKHPLYEATPCHRLVFLIFEASADACAGWCVAMDTVVCRGF